MKQRRRPLVDASIRVYRLLLRIYPERYRVRFAEPMVAAFRDLCEERLSDPISAARLWLSEYPSLLHRGLRERLRRPRPASLPSPRDPDMSRILRWLDALATDARIAVRILRSRPTFTLIVVITLTLGIGLNVALFSVLSGVLLRPLPFADPESLVRVGRASPDNSFLMPISPAEFRDLQRVAPLLQDLEAATPMGGVVTEVAEPVYLQGAGITSGLFALLGVEPFLGRFFVPADAEPGAPGVIVVSHAFWRDRLGGDPDAVGSSVGLFGRPYRVVGVAPPGLTFRPGPGIEGGAFWIPLQFSEGLLQGRHNHFLMLYGRLQPETTTTAASDALAITWRQLVAQEPGDHLDPGYETGMRAESLRRFSVRTSRDPLLFLAGAVGFVLLIACANVANLLLAHAESRTRELALRGALGASRGRLAAQFLVESLLLVGAGGALGVLGAAAAIRGLRVGFPDALPRSAGIAIDMPVLAFAVAVSLLTGLILGLVPLRRRAPEARSLRDAGHTSSGRITTPRKALIIAEVALALMLVVGAGLMLKSFVQAQRSDLGFEPGRLLVANVTLPADQYPGREEIRQFYERLVTELAARPGVESVAMTNLVPIRHRGNNISGVSAAGRPEVRASLVERRFVDPAYFATIGATIFQGRSFTAADAEALEAGNPRVIINRTLAARLFPDGEPVGERLDVGDEADPEIVGVVADIRGFGPDEEQRPYLYYPTPTAGNLVIRTAGEPAEIIPVLRSVVREIESRAAVYRADPMPTIIDDALGDRRFQVSLIAVFAVVALSLGAVGIYGIMAETVEGQRREFGIRMAVGARSGDIHRLVLRHAGSLAALGLALGLVGAFALRGIVAELLFQVSPADPTVYACVVVVMAAVAALACWLPARRAAAADPVETLRTE